MNWASQARYAAAQRLRHALKGDRIRLALSGIKAVLTPSAAWSPHGYPQRFRTALNALALYTIAALVIGYFVHQRLSATAGFAAKQDPPSIIRSPMLSRNCAALKADRAALGTPHRAAQAESLDPTCSTSGARICSTMLITRELRCASSNPVAGRPSAAADFAKPPSLYLVAASKGSARRSPIRFLRAAIFRHIGDWRPHRREPPTREKTGLSAINKPSVSLPPVPGHPRAAPQVPRFPNQEHGA